MISLETATQLKQAGLRWIPENYDFFAIPDRGLDEHIFVISNVMTTVEVRQKLSVISFQGTVEWALDYVTISEAVWLPGEEQLRKIILSYLPDMDQPMLRLEKTAAGYSCSIRFQDQWLSFESKKASEAYAASLLYLLENSKFRKNS
jgi:hypothetical protein